MHDKVNELTVFIENIKNGSTELPKNCVKCPARSCEIVSSIIRDICLLNISVYVANPFFASSETKPKWCPLLKLIEKEKEPC